MMANVEQKNQQRALILAACAKRGIKIEQRGQCHLLTAPGVRILAADLAMLDVKDVAR
jgi:hypothetical protein